MSGRYGFLSKRVSLRDDGYAEGENGYAVAHHAPVAPLPRSLTTFSFRPVEVGNATRREIFVKLMRAAASVLKAALSAFSFRRSSHRGRRQAAGWAHLDAGSSHCRYATQSPWRRRTRRARIARKYAIGGHAEADVLKLAGGRHQPRDLRVLFDRGRRAAQSCLNHDGVLCGR
jgi:hypothetical protein